MKSIKWLKLILWALVLLTTSACEAPYSNLKTFQDSDLIGTWEVRYFGGARVDKLIIRSDRTFKQDYRDDTVKGYVYETPWNKWWVERFPDGRIRLHLQGARYYLADIKIAELDGKEIACLANPAPAYCYGSDPPPFAFYDPIANSFIHMVGELVLNVQRTSSGELVLVHMWTSSDGGFSIIGRESEEFHRVETR